MPSSKSFPNYTVSDLKWAIKKNSLGYIKLVQDARFAGPESHSWREIPKLQKNFELVKAK